MKPGVKRIPSRGLENKVTNGLFEREIDCVFMY